jgi:Na+/proline symporter
VRKETIGEQLAREAREYLADLREIREDLKSAEGWIALALLVAAIVITAVWFIVSLGFNPANDHVMSFMVQFGMRTCRPVDNFNGVIMFVDFIMLIFLTVISLGNVLNMMRRAREGRPREPRDLIISTSLMLVVGIGGIFFMLAVC